MCGCSVIVGDDSGCGEWIKKLMRDFDSSQRTEKIEAAIRWSLDVKNQDTPYRKERYPFYQRKLILFLNSYEIYKGISKYM